MIRKLMKRTFASRRFNTLLLTATITVVIQYLLLLTDSIVIGNILGEQALAAVNVVSPICSFTIFLASLISIGTIVIYVLEIGKFNKDRANRIFSQGIILSLISGLLLCLACIFGRDLYFKYLKLTEETTSLASDYLFYYQFVFILLPLYTVLLESVYSDGDETICNISSFVQIGVNILASILLCFKFGILGVGLGTLIGVGASIIVLLFHFIKKSNTLIFIWNLSLKDIINICKFGITDSSAYLFMGITSFVASKFVIYKFGEYYLPILLVAFNVLELTLVFDGIGQALTPIVNVYRGENNHVGVKRIMKLALKFAIGEGIGVSLILLFFGAQLSWLFGIKDASLIAISAYALRLICPFFMCTGVLFLLTTYYMILEKITLATVITGLKDCLIPSLFLCVLGLIFGVDGVWIGLGVSPFISLVITLLFVYFYYGKDKFPLLLEKPSFQIFMFDCLLNPNNIVKMRDEVEEKLISCSIAKSTINKIMLLIEESGMQIYENNKNKKIYVECTLIIGEEIQVIIKDDGKIEDITNSDNKINSFRSYMLSQMMTHITNKNSLITMGYNRSVYKFSKN